jgi:hypothetical protein
MKKEAKRSLYTARNVKSPRMVAVFASCLLAIGVSACGGGSGEVALSDELASVALARAPQSSGKGNSWNSEPLAPTPVVEPAPTTNDPTPSADVSTTLYRVQTLVDDMMLPNDNGWWMAVNGDLTADRHGPDHGYGRTYAYVSIGIRAADATSYWPKKYLDTSFGFSGSASVRLQGWFVVGRAAQAQPKTTNTRVQTRNFRNLILYRNGSWAVAGANIGLPYPADWHADFSYPGNETTQPVVSGSALDQARLESSGGASVGSVGSGDRTNWTLHGWPAHMTLPLSTWVNDVVGVVTVFEARLVLHDPAKPDDRADANLMVWTGSDWYVNGYVGEYSHGRLKLVGNEWKIFSTTDLPASILRANPPPGFMNE